jgi:hypothetical protein
MGTLSPCLRLPFATRFRTVHPISVDAPPTPKRTAAGQVHRAPSRRGTGSSSASRMDEVLGGAAGEIELLLALPPWSSLVLPIFACCAVSLAIFDRMAVQVRPSSLSPWRRSGFPRRTCAHQPVPTPSDRRGSDVRRGERSSALRWTRAGDDLTCWMRSCDSSSRPSGESSAT